MRRLLTGLALALAPASAAADELKLSVMVGDHAVIQRGQPIMIVGDDAPGSRVTVSLAGNSGSAMADAEGRWQVGLPALDAGGPYRLEARNAAGQTATSDDVMIGDVWLCSGQSNMALPVRRALDFDNQAATFGDPLLRLITPEQATAVAPQSRFARPPAWQRADAKSVPDFSAACYYMARQLRATRGVAIGAINASWGGTQIRAWLDPAATRAIYGPEESALLAQFVCDPLGANQRFFPRWADWWRAASGDVAGSEPWRASGRLTWAPFPAIGYWDQWDGTKFKDFNGYVWARRMVTLTGAQARQGATLSLGVIDDSDQSFVNGTPVANSFSWSDARNYAVPARYWRAGSNEILVLVGDSWGNGGFRGPADELKLTLGDGTVIPLGEGWDYAVAPVKGSAPRPPWDQIAGLGLIHNAMIAPLGPIALDGVAWYQGEADVDKPGYAGRLGALVDGWRRQFRRPDLPVLVVGLANYGATSDRPVESGWAALRDEQRRGVQSRPAMTLVPAIDLGDRLDIHPANKNELGKRLADAADGKPMPMVVDARRSGDNVVVRFTGLSGRFASWNSAEVIGFELCGAEAGSCRFARAAVEGDRVTIIGDGQPVARVRYAWADTAALNLFDADGRPVGSFELKVE